jgi:hypothetical protein
MAAMAAAKSAAAMAVRRRAMAAMAGAKDHPGKIMGISW